MPLTPRQKETNKRAVTRWRAKNPEKHLAYVRKWQLANPEKVREAGRRYKNLPQPDRPAPLTCECCGGAPDKGKVLALDHCHQTQTFRGWLCGKCNRGIGHLGDTIEGLQRAINYLRSVNVPRTN